eukprot:3496524-Amphidinium_carterae.1
MNENSDEQTLRCINFGVQVELALYILIITQYPSSWRQSGHSSCRVQVVKVPTVKLWGRLWAGFRKGGCMARRSKSHHDFISSVTCLLGVFAAR